MSIQSIFLKTKILFDLIVIFLMGSANITHAQTASGPTFPFKVGEWVYIGGNPLNYLLYGATSSLKRDGGIVSVWIMRTTYAYQKPGLIPSISGLSAKTHENIDCYNNKIRFEQKIIYTEIMGGGQPETTHTQPISWQIVVPGTDAAMLYSFFCNREGAWWK